MLFLITPFKLIKMSKVIIPSFKFSSGGLHRFEEVTIPVPWGQISGKWWGNKKVTPVIALHDFRQNAAAFDKVIPKLNCPSVLAIDLPGHGKSSKFPKGRLIYHVDFLIALRHISRKLPAGQLTFLGHGFGSYLAFLYTASYFKQVDAVISVECSSHALLQINTTRSNWLGEITDRFTEIEKTERKNQTEQELVNFYKSTSGQMTKEAASILAERGSFVENSKKYSSLDPRYEMHIMFSFTEEDYKIVLKNVRSKVAVIRNVFEDELPKLTADQAAKNGFFDKNSHTLICRKGPDEIRRLHRESLIPLRETSRLLTVLEYRVLNHILLDNPNLVATAINQFMETDCETHELFHAC